VVRARRRAAVIQEECLEDLPFWVDTNRKAALRVLDLMEAVLHDPYTCIGKPEHLKLFGGNVWLRRINDADRLVYEVFEDRVAFLQARYHYG
jgi:toxin YoeB